MSNVNSSVKTATIAEKLKELRIVYENEKSEKTKKYDQLIREVEDSIKKTKEKDYAAPYVETYSLSLQSLEKLYKEMSDVHNSTKGLSFNIKSYTEKGIARKIPHGKVHDYFNTLVEECRDAIMTVSKNKNVEHDEAPLKKFSQCLVDLRYIFNNARKLLQESGLPEAERSEDLAELKEKYESLRDEAKEASRVENMNCYAKIKALRNEINESYKKLSDNILGTGAPLFDHSYKFLIGFLKNDISKEDRNFGVSVLEVSPKAFERTPIYFEYTSTHDSILINAPKSFLATNAYNDFIRNLYFTFASHLPARNLMFCGIECNTIDAVVGGLGEKINQLGSSYLCHEVVDRASDISVNNGVLSSLRSIANDNSRKQKGESISNIFEYNELFPDNPQKFVLFCVNNYPEGFNSISGSATQDLRQLVNGGSKGIISIICQTTDGDFRESAPILDSSELHADCIEFDENGEMLYNGAPATYDITSDNFSPRDYWGVLDSYFKSAASTSLESLIKANERSHATPAPIAIPIGNSDGEIFNLSLTECTDKLFGLIIGTIGSGKSAFLHTLILSAAYHNSPDDLQFYLADFKDGSGSTEFSHYRKEDGLNNLYIPHVRYLLLKGKSESAFDLLAKIESIRSKRAAILTRAGCSQVTDYNNSEAVRSGREKKLPHIIFVIDEYNAMLNGGNGSDAGSSEIATAIANKIKNLISTVRAYGIGIILCGQSVDKALKNGQALGNMGTRISLPVKSDSELVSLFDLDSYEARKQMQKLAGQGDALVSLGSTSNIRYVRTAYSGKTNGSQQLRIAESIRGKYKDYDYTQVEAGSESAVLVSEVMENDSGYQARENEVVLEMGISSANALRMPLVYSSEEAAANYFACTSKEKLARIEQNAMFAFISTVRSLERRGNMAPVTYLAVAEKHKECLGSYLSELPFLSKCIDSMTNKTDMAKKLIEYRRLYRERKRAADRGDTVKFDPLFLVVRDVAWLNDKEADWLPDFTKEATEKKAAPTKESSLDASAIVDLGKKSGQSFSSDALSMLASFGVATPTTKTESPAAQETERFTVADVKNALATLFAHGNKYGIYLLVSSETYKPITDTLLIEADDKNAILSKYGIYGSFDEYKRHTVDISAPADCIFINYFNSKTCLYDYAPKRCASFWKEIEQKIKNS